MTLLTNSNIRKIAHLARLDLSSTDIEQYKKELSNIITFVEQIAEIDTNMIEAMPHSQELYQRLREDIVTEQNQRELLQKNAPHTEANLYLVPKVIEACEIEADTGS